MILFLEIYPLALLAPCISLFLMPDSFLILCDTKFNGMSHPENQSGNCAKIIKTGAQTWNNSQPDTAALFLYSLNLP